MTPEEAWSDPTVWYGSVLMWMQEASPEVNRLMGSALLRSAVTGYSSVVEVGFRDAVAKGQLSHNATVGEFLAFSERRHAEQERRQ